MNTNINEFRKILSNNNEKILAIFHAQWCPYCLKNLPLIKSVLEKHNFTNFYLVDIGDEYSDVWKETGNVEWALELVPTIRIYEKQNVIFEHQNVIDEKKLIEIINKI